MNLNNYVMKENHSIKKFIVVINCSEEIEGGIRKMVWIA